MSDGQRLPPIVVRRGGEERSFEPGEVVRIGREPSCDIRCESPYIGREHAELRVENGVWTIVDRGSKRGTRHSGRRVTRLPIASPTTVWLGDDEGGEELELVPGEAVVRPPTRAPGGGGTPTGTPGRAPTRGGRATPRRPGGNSGPALRIEIDGHVHQLPPDAPLRIGRDPSNEVAVPAQHGFVSRHHLLIRPTGDHWTVEDTSTRGTFHDGRRISNLELTEPVTLRLGDPSSGPQITISPPGARGRDELGGARTLLGGDEQIRITCGGRDHVFSPGEVITIGRDAASDVVTTNPMTSRRHATLRHDGDGWVLTDAGSGRGTHVDGERVDRVVVDGHVTAWLGPEGTGEEVTLATGMPRRSILSGVSQWTTTAASIAVLALLVGIGSVIWIMDRPPEGTTRPPVDNGGVEEPADLDLDRLKQAAVLISTASDINGIEQAGWGSGTVISPGGLVLTNAHVAAPGAPGLGLSSGTPFEPGPDRYTIFTYAGDDQPVVPSYQAVEVAADGWLDLAVLRIVATVDGQTVEGSALDLPYVEIGDSRELSTGDDLWVLGFPSLARTQAVDVQPGAFASPTNDPRVGDRRGYLNVSAAIRITPGNSGGTAVDASGRLIGVPSWVRPDQEHATAIGILRAIHLAEPLLEAVEQGTEYDQYRFVTRPTGSERAQAAGWVRAGNQDCVQETVTSAPPGTELAAQFSWENIGPGQHVLFGFWVVDASGQLNLAHRVAIEAWDHPASGCVVYDAFNDAIDQLPAGTYRADVRIGANFDQVLAQQDITVGGEQVGEQDVEETGGQPRTLEAALREYPQCREPVLESTPGHWSVEAVRTFSIPYYQLACVYWSIFVPGAPYPVNEEGAWRTPAHVYEYILTNVQVTDRQAEVINEAWEDWRAFLRQVIRS